MIILCQVESVLLLLRSAVYNFKIITPDNKINNNIIKPINIKF